METPLSVRFGPPAVERLAAVLRGGGIAVLPADTIYGFHCTAADPAAVRRVARLKERGAGGFILLVSSRGMAGEFVSDWPGRSREILERLWPGPVTAILPASPSIAAVLRPNGRVALRLPRGETLRALIAAVGSPLVSTSVNRRGEEPMRRIAAIRERYPGLDAYASAGGPLAGVPSTVVDLSGKDPRIVREGALADRARRAIAPR